MQTVREFGFIRIPVPEGRIIAFPAAEPAVVQNEGIDSQPLAAVYEPFNAFLGYVEIHCFPAVYNDRVLYTFIGGNSQMPAAHIVEAAGHASEPVFAVDRYRLRRRKAFSRR